MIEELIDILKIDEGTGPMKRGNHMIYLDSEGIQTVGYGHNIEEKGVSPAVAEMMLHEDLAEAIRDCHRFEWFQKLNDARQAVICSMMYNLGFSRFSGFKKTIGYIELDQYEEAAREMLDSKWSRQVGNRAKRLSKIMETGEF